MSVRPSLASDLARLVHDLAEGDAVRRESAAARLAVIGDRAVPRLIDVAGNAAVSPAARASALGALAAIGDARALPLAIRLSGGEGDEALAAIDVLGALVHGTSAAATTAFDRLAELALSQAAGADARVGALSALDGLPERLLRPLYETLAVDPSSRVVARVVRTQAGAMLSLTELVERLPDDPAVMSAAIVDDNGATKLSTLKRAVDAVRGRELSGATDEAHRRAWTAVLGQLHQDIASRHSRIALYDLRETIERAEGPLPVGFIGAVTTVGDVSCLEPIASAWTASASEGDRWWRDHLADAFRAIVAREKLTRRTVAVRKILERHPAAGALIALAPR